MTDGELRIAKHKADIVRKEIKKIASNPDAVEDVANTIEDLVDEVRHLQTVLDAAQQR